MERVEELISFLSKYNGDDLTKEKLDLIKYLIKTSENDIKKLFNFLEKSNISSTNNELVYNFFKNLVEYHGFEQNNFNTLYKFLKNKEKLGIRMESEIPVAEVFSLIDLASEKLFNNKSLTLKLANFIGSQKSSNIGKFEVLSSVVFHGGVLHPIDCNGDCILDGRIVEIKCSTSQADYFSWGKLKGSSGKIGSPQSCFGYKSIDNILDGIKDIFKTSESLDSLSFIPSSDKFVDLHLLKNQNNILNDYKKFFKNFFYGEVLDYISEKIDDVINYFTDGRTVSNMMSDKMIIQPNLYDEFRRAMGCLYLHLYQHQKQFNDILFISLAGETDKSIYLNQPLLEKHPIDLYNAIKNTGLNFTWQRLDNSAGRSSFMGAFVL